MARTQSTMVELGTVAPPFELPDTVTGRAVGRDSLFADAGGNGLLIMFICPHCPYVKHVEQDLARLGADYAGKLAMAAISSNDVLSYPDDSPEQLKAQAQRLGFPFPYLYDETQEVAREYSAACTPDFFLFDRDLKLVYRGQFDSSRPPREGSASIPVTGEDLRAAIDQVLAGKRPDPNQRASIGCNIKWRE